MRGERSSAQPQRVHALFEGIASRYDLVNDIQSLGMHRLWKRTMAAMADPKPGDSALDVCCGTGDMVRRLSGSGTRVAGVDFSGAMLEKALQGAVPPNPAGPFLVRGDALKLPFGDQRFDLVTISYGLRNLSDLRLGLEEMRRVLKPGGRLLILDFGKPDCTPWRRLYFLYLRLAVPLWGRLFCGDAGAYAYILKSLEQYPAQHGVSQALRSKDFRDITVKKILGGAMSIHRAYRR